MTKVMRPARPVTPGRILRQEIEARGWSQRDLAIILDRPKRVVSELLNGNDEITQETAAKLAQALGSSRELWVNLEGNYRRQMAESHHVVSSEPILYEN